MPLRSPTRRRRKLFASPTKPWRRVENSCSRWRVARRPRRFTHCSRGTRICMWPCRGRRRISSGAMSGTSCPTARRATSAWPTRRCSRMCPCRMSTSIACAARSRTPRARPRNTSARCARSSAARRCRASTSSCSAWAPTATRLLCFPTRARCWKSSGGSWRTGCPSSTPGASPSPRL